MKKQQSVKMHVFKDKVDTEIEACKRYKELTNKLYALLVTANAVVPLEDLRVMLNDTCVRLKQSGDCNPYLSSTLRRIIVENNFKNGNISLSGIPLNRKKLEELVDIPNYNDILNVIQSYDHSMLYVFGYMEEKGDSIVLKSDYENQITEKYSVYATGERQMKAFEKLTNLRDALNDWFDFSNYTGSVDVNGIRNTGTLGEKLKVKIDINTVLKL